MPLAIIIVAIVMIAAGIRGSYKNLAALLTNDFTGSGNFLNWIAAIAIVGTLGYVPALQRFSRMFLALILMAVFLKNGTGVFSQLVSAIQGASADVQHPNPGNPAGASSGSGGGGILGTLGNMLGVSPAVTNAVSGIGTNPLSSLPGATTNPLAQAGGITGIIGNTPAFNGTVNPSTATNIIPDVTSGGFMGP